MYQFYLGINLHLKRSYCMLKDSEGEVCTEPQKLDTKLTIFS